MPGADINRMIDAAPDPTKRSIVNAIEEAKENLGALAQAIRDRLPSARKTA